MLTRNERFVLLADSTIETISQTHYRKIGRIPCTKIRFVHRRRYVHEYEDKSLECEWFLFITLVCKPRYVGIKRINLERGHFPN